MMKKITVRQKDSWVLHPSFAALSWPAKTLYCVVRVMRAGRGEFSLSPSDYEACGFSQAMFHRAKNELVRAGFLDVKEEKRPPVPPKTYSFARRWQEQDDEEE